VLAVEGDLGVGEESSDDLQRLLEAVDSGSRRVVPDAQGVNPLLHA
jgi:hypothetical protein